MFIQVMNGETSDPDALHRQLDLWDRELRPGATGYLDIREPWLTA